MKKLIKQTIVGQVKKLKKIRIFKATNSKKGYVDYHKIEFTGGKPSNWMWSIYPDFIVAKTWFYDYTNKSKSIREFVDDFYDDDGIIEITHLYNLLNLMKGEEE